MLKSGIMRNNDSLHYVGLAVVMLGVFCWRWLTLAQYPFFEDELKSISVMRNIVATGLPLTDAGDIYWRGVFLHYLMAVPLWWFEATEVTARLVPIVLNSLMLPVVWLFARRLAGSVAAWLSVLFMVTANFQIAYAAMTRYYMALELLFLLALYLAGEVWIQRRRQCAVTLFITLFFLLQVHHLSLQILPVLLLAFWFGDRDFAWLKRPALIGAAVALALTAWFSLFWSPGGADTGAAAVALHIGGITDHWAFVVNFQRYAPFAVSLILLGLVPLWYEKTPSWRYGYAAWGVSMLALSFLAPDEAPRYMLHLYPLGVLLAISSLVWWAEQLCHPRRLLTLIQGQRGVAALCLATAIFAIVNLYSFDPLAFNFAFTERVTFSNQKPPHDYIKTFIRPGEKVVSTEPSMTKLYLDVAEVYWLRENFDDQNKTYQPWPDAIKKANPSFFIDSPAALRTFLRENTKGIWLYANQKILWGISPEMDQIVKASFVLKFYHKNQKYVLYRPPVMP